MLRADIVIAELARLIVRQVNDPLGAWSELHIFSKPPIASVHLPLDLTADTPQRDTHRIKNAGGDAVVFAHEAQQQMLGRDIVLSQASGLFLCEEHHTPRPLRKSLPHFPSPTL